MKDPEISETKDRNIGERKGFQIPKYRKKNMTNPEIPAKTMQILTISEEKNGKSRYPANL